MTTTALPEVWCQAVIASTPKPARLCQWCVIDGRCIRGWIVWWSTSGEHRKQCHCCCHLWEHP
jgi:hypothetical protein